MKIWEIISEGSDGKMPRVAVNANRGEVRFRDPGGYDRVYHLNRIMMATAMAGADGKAVDMDQSSWVEKYNIARPYSDEEHAMMQAAFKTIDSDYDYTEHDTRSLELDDTNKTSPTAARKKNRYGV